MSNRREWDVTVRGRIESVTDQDAFPGMFEAALAEESEIVVVEFRPPTWPHTTSVVVRVSADQKKDAESFAREAVLRVFLNVARELIGDGAFGWTLGIDAVLSSPVSPN